MYSYNLFDNEILEHKKICLIIMSIIALCLFIFALIITLTIEKGFYLLIIFSILDFIILGMYYLIYRKYSIKIKINDKNLDVYIKNKYKRTFNLQEFKFVEKDVVIFSSEEYNNNKIISPCLILYRNIELYDLMEYQSYWNENEILIIQNKELIDKVLKLTNSN